jgi:hypothetical protein
MVLGSGSANGFVAEFGAKGLLLLLMKARNGSRSKWRSPRRSVSRLGGPHRGGPHVALTRETEGGEELYRTGGVKRSETVAE